jgi:hypothetical protein
MSPENVSIHPTAEIHPTVIMEGKITVGAYTKIDAGTEDIGISLLASSLPCSLSPLLSSSLTSSSTLPRRLEAFQRVLPKVGSDRNTPGSRPSGATR